jgi:hypothetical protein
MIGIRMVVDSNFFFDWIQKSIVQMRAGSEFEIV